MCLNGNFGNLFFEFDELHLLRAEQFPEGLDSIQNLIQVDFRFLAERHTIGYTAKANAIRDPQDEWRAAAMTFI